MTIQHNPKHTMSQEENPPEHFSEVPCKQLSPKTINIENTVNYSSINLQQQYTYSCSLSFQYFTWYHSPPTKGKMETQAVKLQLVGSGH